MPLAPDKFLVCYLQELEEHGWCPVVLHSWKHLPETIASDIDYAVSGPMPRQLLEFLDDFSRANGWRLIQVIEHEPSAFFCVCVQTLHPFSALQLDVCWNYRRSGHRLVDSGVLLDGARRAPGKPFMVPSTGSEFVYLIAKAAAKGKGFGDIRQRIAELLDENAGLCHAAALQAFSGIPPQDVAEGPEALPAWEEWFANAPHLQPVRSGRRWGADEIVLYLRRVLHPTGFFLQMDGTAKAETIGRIENALMPAFRARIITNRSGWLARICHWLPLVRTQLVIGLDANRRAEVDCDNPNELIEKTIEALANRARQRILSI